MTPVFPAIGNVQGIVIEGADARRFAQTQFAGNVDALAPGRWQWNAWLTAQGRVRALMHLADPGDGTLLAVLRGGDAETVRADLARYLLRMRASLTPRTFAARSGTPLPLGATASDADNIVLGYGARSLRLDLASNSPPDAGALARWRLADIRQGWPNLPAGDPEWLPPALGLERLGAVAFDKGCYPGQEIVARLHYRGGHKYRLGILHGPALLPPGEVRNEEGSLAVRILDAVPGPRGIEALAILPRETLNKIKLMDNIYAVSTRFDV